MVFTIRRAQLKFVHCVELRKVNPRKLGPSPRVPEPISVHLLRGKLGSSNKIKTEPEGHPLIMSPGPSRLRTSEDAAFPFSFDRVLRPGRWASCSSFRIYNVALRISCHPISPVGRIGEIEDFAFIPQVPRSAMTQPVDRSILFKLSRLVEDVVPDSGRHVRDHNKLSLNRAETAGGVARFEGKVVDISPHRHGRVQDSINRLWGSSQHDLSDSYRQLVTPFLIRRDALAKDLREKVVDKLSPSEYLSTSSAP